MTSPAIVLTGRRLLAKFLLDACVIHDATLVRDSTGGSTTTYVARGVQTPCRWGKPTDAENTGSTSAGRAGVALSLPHGTVVREGSRVVNPATTPPKMHEVVANLTPASVMATQVRLLLREV